MRGPTRKNTLEFRTAEGRSDSVSRRVIVNCLPLPLGQSHLILWADSVEIAIRTKRE